MISFNDFLFYVLFTKEFPYRTIYAKQQMVVLFCLFISSLDFYFIFCRINDLSAEKHKMRLSLQERDGIISDLQRR